MKKLAIIILLILVPRLNAQNYPKYDFRLGIGPSLLGSGDYVTLSFENEFNYKLNKYFTTSVSLNFGKTIHGMDYGAAYLQGNLNLLVSPFKNIRKNDFRIGTGFTVMNVFDSYLYTQTNYRFHESTSIGYNIIIEDTYTISGRFIIGLKLYTQPYLNDDINTGISLKFGWTF